MKHAFLSATALATILQFASAQDAAASGFMVRENSAESLATAYGGNGSRADEASTVFNNPAGMMHLKGDEVQLGAAVVFPSIRFDGSATVFGSAIPGNNGGNGGQIAGIPHLYGVFTINDRLKAGLAITAPFGNTINYNPLFSGRHLAVKTAAISVDINPSLAYRLNDWLSVGGGVSAQYFKFEETSAIAQFLIPGVGGPDAVSLFKGDDWAYGYNLGLLAEPSSDTRIGLTYRSKIAHNPEGTLSFTGASPLLGLKDGAATAHKLNVPATIGLSLTRDITPSWSLGADVQFSQWSTLKDVTITSANPTVVSKQGYEDSWMVALGATYQASDRLTWRGGVAWDQSPVVDKFRLVGVPDADRIEVGFGLGYRLTDSMSIDGAYAHYFSAEHASMNRSINNTDPVTGAIVLNGRYTNGLDYVAISLRYKL